MTYKAYYRGALFVPIVLPVCVWALYGVGLLVEEAGWLDSSPPRSATPVETWLLSAYVMLYYGGMVYLAPYLLVFSWLHDRSKNWQAGQFRRALVAIPLGFAAIPVALGLVFESSLAALGLYALLVGGSQALLIGLGDFIGTRLGWLQHTASTEFEPHVA